jgi:signal transduction histidine kinase
VFGPTSKPLEPQSEAFTGYARALTVRFGQWMCWSAIAGCLVAWPFDYLLFSEDRHTLATFGLWRIAAVSLGLLGVGLLQAVRRHGCGAVAALVGTATAEAALCGYAFGTVGGIDQPWFYTSYLFPTVLCPFVIALPARLLGTFGVTAGFLLAYFGTAPQHLSQPYVANAVAFLVVSAAVAVGAGHAIYRLVISNFVQRRELAERASRLEDLDNAKNQLFANLSHELRTPLTLVLASLRGVQTSAGGIKARHIELGTRNAARLLVLINELLDLAQLSSAERSSSDRALVDLGRIVREVTANFRTGRQRAEELVVEGADRQVWLPGDARQLRTALHNLVANAFKFTPPDTRRIRVALEERDDSIALLVEDNGVGIPAQQVPLIFDRFVTVSGGRHGGIGSTGIGLALVKKTVDSHGGAVEVGPAQSGGARFTIRLPRQAATASPQANGSTGVNDDLGDQELRSLHEAVKGAGDARDDWPSEVTESSPGDRRPRVLVVEEDPDLRCYIAEVLERDCQVFTAADCRAALRAVSRAVPDLAVIDLTLPGATSDDLVRTMRRAPRLARVPVVLLTARVAMDGRTESYGAGADDYLAKPFAEAELLARVHNLLALHAQERQLAQLNMRLEHKVAERTVALRKLALHLETSREDERRRLAREIHDETGQLLTALRLEIGIARRQLHPTHPVADALARVDDLVDQVLSSTKNMVASLRPRILDDLGLGAAVEWYVEQFAQRYRVEATCRIVPPDLRVDASAASAAFRTVQEALTNVARHARASRVAVDVRNLSKELSVCIVDDGVGFDPDAICPESFGVFGMRERAQAMGGRFDITSQLGRGTRVELVLPAWREEAAA